MRNFVLTLISFVFFSSTGLVSCSSDTRKAASPTSPNPPGTQPDKPAVKQTVIDDFRIKAPVVRRADSKETLNLDGTFSTALSTEDVLVFPSLQGQDFQKEPIRLEFLIACKSSAGIFETTALFPNVSEVTLRGLLPADIFFQAIAPSGTTSCQIKGIAFNRIGSSHKFTLPTLELRVPDHALDLDVAKYGRAMKIPASERPLLDVGGENSIGFSVRPTPKSEARLFCEGFQTKVSVESGAETALSDLLSSRPEVIPGKALMDLRHRPLQDCRVVLVTATAENRGLWASTYFRLRGEASPLEIRSRFLIDGYAYPHLDMRVFEIRIHNPLAIVVPVGIGTDKGAALTVLPTWFDAFIGSVEKLNIQLRVDGGAQVIESNSRLVFLLPPGGDTVIVGSTKGPCRKQMVMSDRGEVRPGNHFAGYFYDFNPEVFQVMQSATNALDAEGGFTPDFTRTVLPRPSSGQAGRPLPGWAPWTRNKGWDSGEMARFVEPGKGGQFREAISEWCR